MKTQVMVLSLVGMSFASGGNWVLSDYATAASDSLSVATIYGLQTFKNNASTASVTAGAGQVTFKAQYGSDGTEGYTANVGLLHPLTPDWAEIDISGITGISFEYKNSAKITEALAVSFGSGAYTPEIAKAGTVYENTVTGAAALGINTAWKPANLDIGDFATPKWWTAPAGFPKLDSVLKQVKNIQFAPKTLYTLDGTQNGTKCAKCVGPDMTAITLELRNVTLKGVGGPNPWPNLVNAGCETNLPVTVIDDFMDGNTMNKLGGYWYTISDSGSASVPADMADKAKGSSKAEMVVDQKQGGFVTLTASLNKTLGTTWHDYAGWAGLGMGFQGEGGISNTTGVTAISFLIKGMAIDKTVEAIHFKATMKGVSDTAVHSIALASSELLAAEGGKVACVRPGDLKQPSYVAAAHKTPFLMQDLVKLTWEAKITDQKSSAITTGAASFLVSDVKFHGSDKVTSGTLHRKARSGGFSVRASEGALSISGYEGIKSFEVVTLDGKTVASFGPAASVPVSLSRGSYFLVGKGDGAALTKPFAIVR